MSYPGTQEPANDTCMKYCNSQGAQLHVDHVLVKDDEAVVELRSLATAKNGMRFDDRYCMVLTFDGETIVRGRTYLDSAPVARVFEENPIAGAA
jgi:ketosteroid isomerase-like protein